MAEAIILAVSKINAFPLLSLSQEYVKAGSPDSSYFQTLGSLFYGADRSGYNIMMLFFSLGAVLFYYLFYKSRYIPTRFVCLGPCSSSSGTYSDLIGIL